MEKRSLEHNGREYRIILPPVQNRIVVANRVTVLLGGVLATLNLDTSKGGLDSFSKSIANVDPEKLSQLMTDCANQCKLSFNNEVIGNQTGFEKHFGQYPRDTYPVCFWVIWQCVCDFLPESLGAFAQGLPEKIQEEFKSRMDGKSTIGSGGRSGISFAVGGKSQPAK